MSSYYKQTKHPVSGKWHKAMWIDDYFGRHRYGVKFPNGVVFNPEVMNLETKDDPAPQEKIIKTRMNDIKENQKSMNHQPIFTPPESNKLRDWRERFEENRPKTDEKILACRSARCESLPYKFGYKYKNDGEIYEVTDWGNIKSFIEQEITFAKKEKGEEILKKCIEQAEPYDNSKWHNDLSIETIKKIINN